METTLAIVIGLLFACGFYLMLRRSIVKLIIGLGLLGHAFNLLIFTVGGLDRGRPPLVAKSDKATPAAGVPVEPTVTESGIPQEAAGATGADLIANPVPQALILTAIVIGFAVQAFAMVLVYRTVQVVGTDDIDVGRKTDAASDSASAEH